MRWSPTGVLTCRQLAFLLDIQNNQNSMGGGGGGERGISSERQVPSEWPPNFKSALDFQSGASSQNNPTHAHTLWIAMYVYGY